MPLARGAPVVSLVLMPLRIRVRREVATGFVLSLGQRFIAVESVPKTASSMRVDTAPGKRESQWKPA
jgi:hypothetical protein